MVNGIHFIGVDRSGRTPSLCERGEDCEEFQSLEETKKERNKRLLMQHREFKAHRTKAKTIPRPRKCHCSPRKLQPIKEAEVTVVTKIESGATLDASGRDDVMARDRRREVELILHRKFKSSERVRKDKGRMQRTAAKDTLPWRVFVPNCWNYVVRTFVCAIRLYSCSAARYAMFKSLRRFKPGD